MEKENDRYNDQTTGENEQMETEAIKKLFPSCNKIEKVTDKELQFKGVDYIAYFKGRRAYIDCKVHHYKSDFFVYECYDTRPIYKDYGWTNKNIDHLTTYIVYIIPYYKKAYCYYYKEVLNYQETVAFKLAEETRTYHGLKHYTSYKIFPSDFIGRREVEITVPEGIVLKDSYIPANSTDSNYLAFKAFVLQQNI